MVGSRRIRRGFDEDTARGGRRRGGGRGERLVGSGIDALADQLLAQVSVPVVLYLVVRTPWNSSSYKRPPAYAHVYILITISIPVEYIKP